MLVCVAMVPVLRVIVPALPIDERTHERTLNAGRRH